MTPHKGRGDMGRDMRGEREPTEVGGAMRMLDGALEKGKERLIVAHGLDYIDPENPSLIPTILERIIHGVSGSELDVHDPIHPEYCVYSDIYNADTDEAVDSASQIIEKIIKENSQLIVLLIESYPDIFEGHPIIIHPDPKKNKDVDLAIEVILNLIGGRFPSTTGGDIREALEHIVNARATLTETDGEHIPFLSGYPMAVTGDEENLLKKHPDVSAAIGAMCLILSAIDTQIYGHISPTTWAATLLGIFETMISNVNGLSQIEKVLARIMVVNILAAKNHRLREALVGIEMAKSLYRGGQLKRLKDLYGGISSITSPDGGISSITSPDRGISSKTSPDGGISSITSPDRGISSKTSPDRGISSKTSPDIGSRAMSLLEGTLREQYFRQDIMQEAMGFLDPRSPRLPHKILKRFLESILYEDIKSIYTGSRIAETYLYDPDINYEGEYINFGSIVQDPKGLLQKFITIFVQDPRGLINFERFGRLLFSQEIYPYVRAIRDSLGLDTSRPEKSPEKSSEEEILEVIKRIGDLIKNERLRQLITLTSEDIPFLDGYTGGHEREAGNTAKYIEGIIGKEPVIKDSLALLAAMVKGLEPYIESGDISATACAATLYGLFNAMILNARNSSRCSSQEYLYLSNPVMIAVARIMAARTMATNFRLKEVLVLQEIKKTLFGDRDLRESIIQLRELLFGINNQTKIFTIKKIT